MCRLYLCSGPVASLQRSKQQQAGTVLRPLPPPQDDVSQTARMQAANSMCRLAGAFVLAQQIRTSHLLHTGLGF